MADHKKLKKELTLFDVFAISTGAMFSSGFFLLPGLASAQTGPSVVIAYLIAAFLVLPAMLSQAELATAMPRAGGTYYFIDRSMGPLFGTIGGIGTWFSLIFKTAFALIGIGAYLIFFVELPIKPIAIFLTVVFAIINVVGAKETGKLQSIFVILLLSVLAFFTVQGLFEVFGRGIGSTHAKQFTPFAPFGISGLLTTVGMVFVSYAGLTKVASVAEEVQNPDRNIPLGMALSLFIVTFFYVVGVYIMVSVLDPSELRADLTPVATASEAFFHWLPGSSGLLLIVIAALAAFASTGNAGIMSASRYPLAMARDRLVPEKFALLGRHHTPTRAIIGTSALIIVFILMFDAASVAKLASAFQLLIFAILNLAVIVMRESKIPSYVPGYRSPFYPWTQIVGAAATLALIATMGLLSIAFTGGMIVCAIAWYFYYGRHRAEREGAVYHLFARLGQRRDEKLDYELRGILKEKDAPEEALYERLITRAATIDIAEDIPYEEVVKRACAQLALRLPLSETELVERFAEGRRFGATPVSHGAALPHLQLPDVDSPALVLVRSCTGLQIPGGTAEINREQESSVYALFFMVSPQNNPSQHLQVLAHLARRIDESGFMQEWKKAANERELKESLLHHERYLSLDLRPGTPEAEMIGQTIREVDLPEETLVVLIQRGHQTIIPHGSTRLETGDRVTIIGNPEDVQSLYRKYSSEHLHT